MEYMDANALQIFRTVAGVGSVSRAAEELHYVQSNVSARIKQLENDLGAPLFYRKSRGLDEETAIFESAVLVADVPLRPEGWKPTVYVRFGDWFANACWVVSALALGGALRRGLALEPENSERKEG